QCCEESHELPAAEVLFQDEARQDDCYSGVKGRDDNRVVEASVLAGVDEEDATDHVETASNHSEACRGAGEFHGGMSGDNSDRRYSERGNARDHGDPAGGATGLMDKEIESRETDARQRGSRYTFWPSGFIVLS